MQNPPKLRVESRKAFPLVTAMLITGIVLCYYQVSVTKNDTFFITQGYGFVGDQFYEYVKAQNWNGIGKMLWGTFASIHVAQMFINGYFFWVFANHVEQKIGPGRLMVLVVLGVVVPWAVTAWDTHLKSLTVFFGPAMLLCSILGAYMAVPPDFKRIHSWMPKPRNQIFNRGEKKDITQAYDKDPMIYIVAFFVVQTAFHFACTGTPWFPGLFPKYDTINILGALAGMGIGYGMTIFLLVAATGSVQDAPLKLSVLKHYRSLTDIDVPHEQALMGTAKALGLPYEQVRDWVQQGKGKMKVS